jgi:CRISPR/Cas system-associated endonuclease Cas1
MNPLVVEEFGARLTVNHTCLVLDSKTGGEILRIEPRQIEYDSIVFLNHNGIISLEALTWLSWYKIPLFVIDWRGRLQTSIIHEHTNQGVMRLKQYQAHLDTDRR